MGRVGAGVVWRRVGALVAARRWRGRVLLSSTQGTHKGPHSTHLYPCPYAIPGQVRSAEQHTYLSELEMTSESLHFSAYALILKTCEELLCDTSSPRICLHFHRSAGQHACFNH